jgi:uncharacterized protein (DUF885 family)
MKWLGIVALLVILVSASAGSAEGDEDARLSAFFKSYLEEEFRQRPMAATALGDHRFDHLLDDVSAKARAGWLERYRKTLAELPRAVDYKKLSRPA